MSANDTGTGTTTPAVPPMPSTPPTVGTTRKKGVKGLVEVFQKTYGTGKDKTKKARTKVTTATAPARKKTQAVATAVSASTTGSWSFLWSVAAAWAIPVTFPVALLDRIALIFGSPRPLSGMDPMAWNFLHGPGTWFADQMGSYIAAGETHRVFLLGAVGIGPVLFAQLGEKIPNDGLRKFLRYLAYGFPAFWILGKWYFDHWGLSSFGFHSMGDLLTTVLFATSWWGFSYARTIQPGLGRFLLWIPLASVLIGICRNSAGAAF